MIRIKKNTCTGCRICEVICSMEHSKTINNKLSRIRYRDDWPRVGILELCRQCKAKQCKSACVEEALTVNQAGLVELNKDLCNGCMSCIEACPFGSFPTYNGLPLFCDTCNGRYSCVQWCPTKALEVE